MVLSLLSYVFKVAKMLRKGKSRTVRSVSREKLFNKCKSDVYFRNLIVPCVNFYRVRSMHACK